MVDIETFPLPYGVPDSQGEWFTAANMRAFAADFHAARCRELVAGVEPELWENMTPQGPAFGTAKSPSAIQSTGYFHEEHVAALLHRIKELEAALNEIASWSEGDVVGSHFDEPGAAQIARSALAHKEPT